MRKRNQSFDQTPLVGGNSLLIIFAVLCLTIFAMLTMASARADRRLGDASANSAAAYYAAEYEAESILAGLRNGIVPKNVKTDKNVYEYKVSISETQRLAVKVELDGEEYRIIRWNSEVCSENWQPDFSIEVWDGR